MKKLLILILLMLGLGVANAQQAPANWTIMHYTAVDNDLEGAAFNDYYEMQGAGSGEGVNIVAQLDRAEGHDARFGDWTDTRRFLIERVEPQAEATLDEKRAAVVDYLVAEGAGDAETLAEQAAQTPDNFIESLYREQNLDATFEQTPIETLGEVDMGDPQSLVDFVVWSVQNFPAEHYMLVIGSHGGGWRGIGPDDGDGQQSMLDLPEIDAALATARDILGLGKLDIVGFDACLMAVTDAAVMLEPHADYILAAQEVIPGNGWEYLNSITAMQQNPGWDAYDVATTFVDTFMEYYAGKGGRTKVGLSLVETAGLPDLRAALEAFSATVGGDTAALLSALGTARNNSQIFGASLGDRADFYSYVDLRDFMNWFSLQTSISEDAYLAAQSVIAAYDAAVVYSRADDQLPRATGLAVYLPATFASYDATYPDYAPADFAFWQAYLDQFFQTIATELDGSTLQLEITNVLTLGEAGSLLDAPVVFFNAAGVGVVDLSYTIFYVGEDGTRTLVDTSPISYTTILPTGETLIEYPNELTPSTFTWSVQAPFISDGTNSVLGVASASVGSSEMSVSGTYVTPEGSQPAVLVFNSDTLAYQGLLASDGDTVYEASPNPGDQFIVDLISISPDGEVLVEPQADAPLTFGLQPFIFTYDPAFSGVYEIGLAITDLAGNTVRQQAQLLVNNDDVDGSTRGYTDTNEGVYFQYPYAWGDSYTFTNDDGSITNALSDDAGEQALYVDAYLETDAATALQTALDLLGGDVGELTEITFGGLSAYGATVFVASDEGATTYVVISVANEPAASVVVLTFAGTGDGVEPDTAVLDLVDATLGFFPPYLD